MSRSVDELLADARARLARVTPQAAATVASRGGLLVDLRPQSERQREGEMPGAVAIGRNVLEWRLDPSSLYRIDAVTGYEQPIVLVCTEGYASSLAAAVLQDLGLVHATDMEGGFRAWVASGLPVHRPGA
ncbi:MAG TPA: rhodanese-like domain-containing protein [Candidatus Binatia bacterium]|jgi:rhodanese-related sulfurtransferase|nr:rhodanese-like domain-containing protein [Candidatus Binatia bacterium]